MIMKGTKEKMRQENVACTSSVFAIVAITISTKMENNSLDFVRDYVLYFFASTSSGASQATMAKMKFNECWKTKRRNLHAVKPNDEAGSESHFVRIGRIWDVKSLSLLPSASNGIVFFFLFYFFVWFENTKSRPADIDDDFEQQQKKNRKKNEKKKRNENRRSLPKGKRKFFNIFSVLGLTVNAVCIFNVLHAFNYFVNFKI